MTDLRAGIGQIEADIRRLEGLKQSGAMPADLADASIAALRRQLATYQAELHGSGANAQGENARAAGERAVLADGAIDSSFIVTGDGNEINVGTQPRAKKESLREAYLSYVLEQVSPLALSGVVRQAASQAETRMNLSAVYTALLTQSQVPVPEEFLRKRDARAMLEWESQTRRFSVVESMNQLDHMVLLGDPGSGKSTFINFVALSMVGEALGREDANLKALTQPLPQDEASLPGERDREPQPQPWDHGALIPVRLILRDFTARGLPPTGETTSAEHIWKFMEGELDAASLSEFGPLLKKELRDQGGLILFDGLDEVPEAEDLRDQIRAAIESFSAAFPRCRVLVTSRTYAYQRQDWKLKGFTETVLAPYTRGQISQFVERWYAHIARLRSQNEQDARGKAELLKHAIFSSDRLLGLAERPLLLTLMASLHAWRGGTLPDKREELYADAVDLLLDWWESQRAVRDTKGVVSVVQPSLAEWLQVDRQKVRDLLNRLAYDAHAGQSDLIGTADIPENALIAGLMDLSQNPDLKPARLIEYLRDRAGLLIPRGVGVYTFPHRTFQEYLAACHLTDHDYPELIAKLTRMDPNRWREVALLAGAKAAGGAAVFALWSLVDALSPEREGDVGEARYWGAQIAGEAVIEIADFEKGGELTKSKVDRVRMRLLDIVQGNRLPAVERAQAGHNLSTLGDPRFNPDFWFLPNDETLGFTLIPAGKFRMGSENEDDRARQDEKPQHEVTLPNYWMAKYPVTVGQFRAFTEAIKYSFERWQDNNVATKPIVAVTWDEALAYTKWLDMELRQYAERRVRMGASHLLWQGLADGQLHITLPSEAEWEKAARGTDASTYPWGNEFDPDKANTDETGVSETSVVGCFPAGISPYGVLDMSGNTWDWTRNLWGEDWQKPADSYPYEPNDLTRENLRAEKNKLRILRGGSFKGQAGYARCAFRLPREPGDGGRHRGF